MDGQTDWLIDWPTDGTTDWLDNWLTDWLTDSLTDWLTDSLTDWLTDWWMGRQTGWLTDEQWDRQTDWLAKWLTDWWMEGQTRWLTDRLIDWLAVINGQTFGQTDELTQTDLNRPKFPLAMFIAVMTCHGFDERRSWISKCWGIMRESEKCNQQHCSFFINDHGVND